MLTKKDIKKVLNVVLWFAWAQGGWSDIGFTISFGFVIPLTITFSVAGLFITRVLALLPIYTLVLFVAGSCIANFVRFLLKAYEKLPEGTEDEEKPKQEFVHLEDGEVAEVIEDDGAMPEKRKRDG